MDLVSVQSSYLSIIAETDRWRCIISVILIVLMFNRYTDMGIVCCASQKSHPVPSCMWIIEAVWCTLVRVECSLISLSLETALSGKRRRCSYINEKLSAAFSIDCKDIQLDIMLCVQSLLKSRPVSSSIYWCVPCQCFSVKLFSMLFGHWGIWEIKMQILSLFTHLYNFLSSADYKRRYFEKCG